MERKTFFADILLPLPLRGSFTYRVPAALNDRIRVGQRAVVPFGRYKVYAGLVKRIHEYPPRDVTARYLHQLLDEEAILTPLQFRFWEWMAGYYLCSEGEVMHAALPPAMKLAGETRIALHPHAAELGLSLNKSEQALVRALENKAQLSLKEVSEVTELPKVISLINTMMEKGLLVLKEELQDTWRFKTIPHVCLSPPFQEEEALKALLDKLEKKAFKQLEIMMRYLQMAAKPGDEGHWGPVQKDSLTMGLQGGSGALKALIDKGALVVEEQIRSRFEHLAEDGAAVVFNGAQQQALQEIREGFGRRDVVLLHGVTSSGKTELYMHLIREALDRGEQVLYLLPEIALTTQIIHRLQRQFGSRAGIYHSRFNPMERTEVWKNLLQGGMEIGGKQIRYDLILGPRSALFLPFRKLGLVIVDEEHESGFKQQDPAPRYHARDAAIYLAGMHGARVLLGSATPSLETYQHAMKGKFAYVELKERHGGMKLPEIVLADLKKESMQKSMKSHFSSVLIQHMREALDEKKQVILFKNRRGFSPRLECDLCHWMPECHQCDVTLVYHKQINRMKCHYCGHAAPPPAHCGDCGATALRLKGFGTEKVEEELPLFFPGAVVKRMDLDTTRSRNAYRQIIEDFEKGRIDILVGTQMISKGLDFDHVGLVGILNADQMLGWPDFRAHERAFQLMAQVSGRAGRAGKQGRVVIQAWNPAHPIIQRVVAHDYEGMAREELSERKKFRYPPFVRIIHVQALHRDPRQLNPAASHLAERLREAFPAQVFGPEYPLVARIRNTYMKHIMVKLPRDGHLAGNKQRLQEITEEVIRSGVGKGLRVIIDVDPQ